MFIHFIGKYNLKQFLYIENQCRKEYVIQSNLDIKHPQGDDQIVPYITEYLKAAVSYADVGPNKRTETVPYNTRCVAAGCFMSRFDCNEFDFMIIT